MSYSANHGIEYCTMPHNSPCGYTGCNSLESRVTVHNSEVETHSPTSIETALEYKPSTHQPDSYISGLYLDNKTVSQSYAFSSDDFLNPSRLRQRFVGKFDNNLKQIIEKTFLLTTGQPFPDDIVVNICDEKQMKKAHPGWNPGIMGFALNRKASGQINEIFILQTELDRLMLTLGHELGHVMSKSLPNSFDEEAKAFAFSIAWMDTIVKHNISNLANSINIHDKPASNGLHDIAFNFVKRVLQQGTTAISIFKQLVTKQISVLDWMMR